MVVASPPGAPAAPESLPAIEQRLARIEASLARVDQLAVQIPLLLATVTEIADSWAAKMPDLDHRLETVTSMLERLTRPNTIRTLEKLLDVLEQAPQLVSTGTDIMDEVMRRAAESGVETEAILENSKELIRGLFTLSTSPEVQHLLTSGMLDQGAVQTLSRAASALAEARKQTPKPVGIFGLLRALNDPEVGRALGFTLTVASAFGHELRADASGGRPRGA